MSRHRVAIAALAVSAVIAPTSAQQGLGLTGFLTTIGGDTNLRTIGGDKNPELPQLQPLVRDKADVLGYRFYKESILDRSTVVERSLSAFRRECEAKAGRVLDASDPVVRAFQKARIVPVIPKSSSYTRIWRSEGSVCVASSGEALGAVAMIVERRDLPASNDPAAALSLFLPTYRRTAVYAYHPRAVVGMTPELVAQGRVAPSAQEIAAKDEARLARFRAEADREEARNTEFRRKLDVGSDTNCGTVIQVRGPMVEVAVSPMRATPNGQSTFWAKKTALYPPGPSLCAFGL